MRPLLGRPSPASLLATTCRACQRRYLRLSARPVISAVSTTVPLSWVHNNGRVYNATQRRGITEGHLRKTAEAKEQWDGWAKEIKQGQRQSFASKLKERGLIHDVVGGDFEMLDKIMTQKRVGIYAGVDPTAPSLHMGHMVPIMVLGWAYVHGIKSVYLLGGSTSTIGDPTGRVDSRPVMSSAVRRANIANMHMQLKKLGASFERMGANFGYQYEWAWRRVLENNNTWWQKESMIHVLSRMASHMRLGTMLGRDNVRSRLDNGDGMSLAEFCYPLMQAWDYWHLFQKGTQIQIGGSDQYGNILLGVDMIKQMLKDPANKEFGPQKNEDPDLTKPIGFTTPLLTSSTGEKFGKSAGNAVWLDADMTPPYDLYQYFMRLPDADMERYLKLFTFYPIPDIQQIMTTHNEDPSKRVAQHKLASQVVQLIHGTHIARQVEKQHRLIFSPGSLDPRAISMDESPKVGDKGFMNQASGDRTAPAVTVFSDIKPHVVLPRSLVVNQFFHKVLYHAGMVSSKAEGHRLIVNNGAHVGSMPDSKQVMGDALNYVPIRTWTADITEKFIIDNCLLILRVGKWKVKIVKIVPDEEFRASGMTCPGWGEEVDPNEKQEDKKLFAGSQKIKGRWVKPPLNSQKPKIQTETVSLFDRFNNRDD